MPNDNTILDYHETWNNLLCFHCGCIINCDNETLLGDAVFCSNECCDKFINEHPISELL